MLEELERQDFVGKIIRRDPDGYGVVDIESSDGTRDIGVFTVEVLQNPEISKLCVVGSEVIGRAAKLRSGYRILRLEPKYH